MASSTFDDHEIRNDWVSVLDDWKMGLDGNDPDAPAARSLPCCAGRPRSRRGTNAEVRKALLPRSGFIAANREFPYGDLMAMQVLDTYASIATISRAATSSNPPAPMSLQRMRRFWARRRKSGSPKSARWRDVERDRWQVTMMSLDRRQGRRARKDRQPRQLGGL